MFDWRDFRFHEVTQIPQPDEGEDEGRRGRREDRAGALAASLTGSHADLRSTGRPGAALATAWVRAPGEHHLHVLLGGRPLFPPAVRPVDGEAAASQALLFPPGAVGVTRSAHDVTDLLRSFSHWVPCVARPDALWAPAGEGQGPAVRRGSFDRHVAHLRGSFAWLVVAEPLAARDLDPELRGLVNQILPLSRSEVGEADRVELERKRARHRELSRAQHGGAWRVRVLVGSVAADGARTAAAMLCAASELHGLPYVLEPAGDPVPAPDPRTAFVAGPELLVALTRPPERELPGLRLVEPHGFDVTPERTGDDGGLRLGAVLDEGRVEVGDLRLGEGTLNRHTFVCGATGAGKSQTVRHLLAQASRAGVPWLVVEPAKAEYSLMDRRLAALGQDVIVIRPGDVDTAPAGFNPLEPVAGFPLQAHADLLRTLFLAAFEAQEPFPQILAAALTRCYEELGWDLTLGLPAHSGRATRYPTLGDLQRVAAAVVDEIGYGKEIAGNVAGFIKVRLSSLRLGTAGRFFEGGHPLSFDELCRRNVVLQIEDMGDDADKAFFMGAVLMRLSEHLRMASRREPRGSRLVHLTVIEEAHRLLRRPEPGTAGAAAHAVEMFAAMLAEVRAYGEGLIIAEQIPGKLVPDVIKNTAVKIVHRLPAKDDRDSVGATMNVGDAQSRYIVSLVPGECAVFTDGMDRPLLVRVPDGTSAEESPHRLAAPLGSLIGRRSATCGVDCLTEACTLKQIRSAAHLLAAEPWLVAWAELAVLAHLTGQPVPVPTEAVRTAFLKRGRSRRLVDCALSHAVDDAVAVRSPVLSPESDPESLAAHVLTALTRMLDGRSPGCQDDAMGHLATPFRWELVRHALAGGQGDGRDARSAEWEARFQREIPGETRAAQLDAVRTWLVRDLADTSVVDSVTYGARRPSTLEAVVGTAAPDRAERLKAALEWFIDCTWPLIHLRTDQ
ncbi:MAG: ATP-binding protein [Actinoallomurus sp.]